MNIEISNLSKSYQNKTVFTGVNSTLKAGEIVGLLGKNGAGKSTLFNLLLGLIKPDKGHIMADGREVTAQNMAFKKRLGAITESNPLIEEFTGWQYLQFVGALHQLEKAELQARIKSLFAFFFDEESDLHKRTGSYSTGMKKKIALCAAVLHRPDLLVLDEPFSGLDPLAAQQMIKFLKAYHTPERLILISSHELSYLEKIATQIMVLNQQQIVYNAPLQQFLEEGESRMDEALYRLLVPVDKDMSGLGWMTDQPTTQE